MAQHILPPEGKGAPTATHTNHGKEWKPPRKFIVYYHFRVLRDVGIIDRPATYH